MSQYPRESVSPSINSIGYGTGPILSVNTFHWRHIRLFSLKSKARWRADNIKFGAFQKLMTFSCKSFLCYQS